MERQLMVDVPNVRGEDGLSVACRQGMLFRYDEQLEKLYREGFRIYNYSIENEAGTPRSEKPHTRVRVFLKK